MYNTTMTDIFFDEKIFEFLEKVGKKELTISIIGFKFVTKYMNIKKQIIIN